MSVFEVVLPLKTLIRRTLFAVWALVIILQRKQKQKSNQIKNTPILKEPRQGLRILKSLA